VKSLLWVVLSLFVLALACNPSQQAQLEAEAIPYRVAATYQHTGREWKAVVVAPGSTDTELVVLAKQLHADFPETSFYIFDDDSGVQAYVDASVNYPSPDFPYPEEWTRQHEIGMINRMATGHASEGTFRMKWQLFGGEAHPTNPMSEITALE